MPELSPLAPTPRVQEAKVQVVALAQRQWGVVKRSQLLQVGLSGGGISRWIADGRLHRIHPNVYAVGHPGLGIQGKLAAALFYAGKGAALFHMTSVWWWSIVKERPARIHVCIRGKRRSLPDVCIHSQKRFKRVVHRGLPVIPPAQALLQMASLIGPRSPFDQDDLRLAVAEAEYRRLVTLNDIAAQLGRGKPGSTALRKALEHHLPNLARTKSVLEVKFLLLRERYSLTPPDGVNAWIGRWKVDAVWYARKVVVELDSRTAHEADWRIDRDHQRDMDLRAAGYTVLRYTWQQVTETPELVAADLRRALGL